MTLTPAQAIAQMLADQTTFHAILNGPAGGAGSTVETDSGTMPTLANLLAQLQSDSATAVLATPAAAAGALILRGHLGSGLGAARPDAGFELQADGATASDTAILSIYMTQTALSWGEAGQNESAMVFMLNNTSNAPLHCGSISSIWADKTPSTGWPVMRIAQCYDNATVEDTVIAIHGGKGLIFHAGTNGNPAEAPGLRVTRINGPVIIAPTDPGTVLEMVRATNAAAMATIENFNTGTAACGLSRLDNGTHTMDVFMFGTGFTPAGVERADGALLTTNGAGGLTLNGPTVYLATGGTERSRITSGGLHLIGATSAALAGGAHHIETGDAPNAGNVVLAVGVGTTASLLVGATSGTGFSGANTAVYIGKDNVTSRSINAGGTVNINGADYAEYEEKADGCGSVTKGDVVGFNTLGQIVDRWSEIISVGVKTTNPSIVGGDVHGNEQAIGPKPIAPGDLTNGETVVEYQARWDTYISDLAAFEARLEGARQRVDRIAYAGKVPVNVLNAKPGDYIIATQNGDGIKGIAVSAALISSDQYRLVVGRVRKILPDGRALISVIVH